GGQMVRHARRSARELPSHGNEVEGVQLFGVYPSALGKDRMVGRAADGHSIGELQATQLSTPARPDAERLERTILGDDQVTVVDLSDRLAAAVGHLDQR